MIIKAKHYEETMEEYNDIISIEKTIKDKIQEIRVANSKLESTLGILIGKPPVTLASKSINLRDFRISRFIRYTRYGSRSMNIDNFIEFCDIELGLYEARLSVDGKRYIPPLVPLFRNHKPKTRVIVKFPLGYKITTHELTDYRSEFQSRTHLYERGEFEPDRLELFSTETSSGYRNEGNHSGITAYLPYWPIVKDRIKSNMSDALMEADLYIEKVNILNIATQEILFPLYAKRDLFNLESMYLTNELYTEMKPAIDYGRNYIDKVSKMRLEYRNAKNKVEELLKTSYNGKMNLSTKPFEFFFNTSDPGETHHFKIDGHILEKTHRASWMHNYRYSAIYDSSFLSIFVPNWKDEYLPNIRFQYREIFARVIEFAKTYKSVPTISIEKNFIVEPKTFFEYPEIPAKFGPNMRLEINEDYGLRLYNNITRNTYNQNMESANYYSILYSYKDQFDELYALAKEVFDAKTEEIKKQQKELEEIFTPFLIAKALFLESYEQKNSR